jgi:hygromycin-B 4-O-kinase
LRFKPARAGRPDSIRRRGYVLAAAVYAATGTLPGVTVPAPGASGPPEVSPAEARSFLDAKYGAVREVSEAGRGEWSVAYAFEAGGRQLVARFGRLREDFEKDRIAALFASPALPVPAILEIGETAGTYYAISELVRGAFLEQLDAAGMRRALPALFAALDAARTVDISRYSGYGMFGVDGIAPHPTWRSALLAIAADHPSGRIAGWRRRLEEHLSGARAFDRAYNLLEQSVAACPDERHLLHGDLLNRNVFVQGELIAGVIDWGCGAYGDFLYDVAQLTFWRPWYTAWREVDIAAEAQRHYSAIGLDVPGFAERLRCCELSIGLDACAYQAYLGRWDDLAWTVRRLERAIERAA